MGGGESEEDMDSSVIQYDDDVAACHWQVLLLKQSKKQ